VKAEHELDHSDWVLIHQYRNSRGLLKRKGLKDKLRAFLEGEQPELWAESQRRGVPEHLMLKWRAYPDRSAGVSFGHSFDRNAEVKHLSPKPAPKRRREALKPQTTDGGTLREQLIASVDAAMGQP
jgi:hypothetical protein